MKKNLSYLVIGAGGTGGPLGAFLTKAGKDVTMIARGRHLEAMKAEGLKIRLSEESFSVPVKVSSMEEYKGSPDVIFVCVKGYSLNDAAEFIKELSGPHTVVIPILNIYGTGGTLQKMLPEVTVTDGCIYIAAEISKPGEILMSGRIFRVVFGLRKGTENSVQKTVMPVLETVADDLREAEIIPLLSSCIERDALQKFSFVSPMAAVGACFGVTAAAMQKGGEKRELFAELVGEIQKLSKAMGAELPSDLVETNLKIMDDLAPTATASMQRDIAAGKNSEVDGLVYRVVELGEKYQVSVPAYKGCTETLKNLLN